VPEQTGSKQNGWLFPELKHDCNNRQCIEGSIQEAVRIINEKRSQADSQTWFPLLSQDLHPRFKSDIFPKMLSVAARHGVLIIGKPGKGKTPIAKVENGVRGTVGQQNTMAE